MAARIIVGIGVFIGMPIRVFVAAHVGMRIIVGIGVSIIVIGVIVVTAGEPVIVVRLGCDTGMPTGMRTTEPNIGMRTGMRTTERIVGMYTTKCGIGMCITERRVRMTVTERRIGMRIIKCGVVMQPMFVLSLPKKMELTI